ncbi:hypothetical protein DVH05_004587 [Phytophthora capsici]|nr:hypothetical protein DVH05_004587 [Phytophthora capsici]
MINRQTGLLNKEDYVTTANVFVDASASDYVLCFQQCLDSPIGEDEGVKRTLVLQNGGNLKIQLSLKTHLLHFTRNIDYTFELKPIAVERIDILESKLKDVQEELGRLRGKIGSGTTVLFYVESEAYLGSKLQWKEVPGTNFTLSEDKTSIKVLVPGLYSFGLVVNHNTAPNSGQGLISLQMNDEKVQSVATSSPHCRNGGYTTFRTSSSLMCIVQVEKDASFTVHCTYTAPIPNVPSYLMATRIGG